MRKNGLKKCLLFLHPRCWCRLVVVFFMILIGRLPFSIWMKFGAFLGGIAYYLVPKRRAVAERNIKRCFPHYSDVECHQVVRKNFQNMGIGAALPSFFFVMSRSRLERLHYVEGLDHYIEAKRYERPIILVGMHNTNVLTYPLLLSHYTECFFMYRFSEESLLFAMIEHRRSKYAVRTLDIGNMRGAIKRLYEKKTLCIFPDHNVRQGKNMVFVDFFGHKAAMAPSVSLLAKRTNAIVMMVYTFFDQDKKKYGLRFLPPLEGFSKEKVADSARINHAIENFVSVYPDQYFWVHRRFKTTQHSGTETGQSIYD